MVPRSWFVDGEQEWARIKMGSAEIGFRSRRFTALRFARLLKKGWASFGQLVKLILNLAHAKNVKLSCFSLGDCFDFGDVMDAAVDSDGKESRR